MNLLEQYIIEIHEEKSYQSVWTKYFNDDFVEIDLTKNCYAWVEDV